MNQRKGTVIPQGSKLPKHLLELKVLLWRCGIAGVHQGLGALKEAVLEGPFGINPLRGRP